MELQNQLAAASIRWSKEDELLKQLATAQARVKELERDLDASQALLRRSCEDLRQQLDAMTRERDHSTHENAHADQQTRQILFHGLKERDIVIQRLEAQAKEARAEIARLEGVVQDYKVRYAALAELTATQGHHLCLFDGINPDMNPVMGLACPCPRCSPR